MTDEVQEIVTTTTAFKCVKCGEVWSTEEKAKVCAQKHIWPKKIKVYLHGGKDSDMWGKGREIGLSEKVCEEEFRGALYEVTFDIEVSEDGTYKILRVYEGKNGPFYVDPVRIIGLIDHAITQSDSKVSFHGGSAVDEYNRLMERLSNMRKEILKMIEGK